VAQIRVFLAEDHTLVRVGIATVLRQLEGIEVVGQAADGREAIARIAQLQPDVVLMDIAMPGLNGLEATARLTREHPRLRVIILSMHANEEYVAQALQAGAAGYLLKGADLPELELAIRAAARGESYLTPAVSKQVVDEYRGRLAHSRAEPGGLTSRQREILQLIAEGHTTKDVARRLNLSVKTIESHRAKIMERLGIHDLAGLVRYAIRSGLVSSQP
jgi:DNA-binding NarL/FixJ family response regulator